jgi:hypothetical protein
MRPDPSPSDAHAFDQSFPTRDARLLLDIGLARAADGTLVLAADPSQPAHPSAVKSSRTVAALLRFLAALGNFVMASLHYLRRLPLRGGGIGLYGFLRE